MPGFEEEAMERARQLSHSRRTPHQEPPKEPPKPPPPKPPVPAPAPLPPKPAPNLIDTLLRDKEASLILMLLTLLMDEPTDPSLLFALMYLLM